MYVTMSGGGSAPDPVGVFLSTNQGGTWTQRSGSGISGTTYGGYALDMTVDPQSPGDGAHDTLYYGCQNQFKSTDSGNNSLRDERGACRYAHVGGAGAVGRRQHGCLLRL